MDKTLKKTALVFLALLGLYAVSGFFIIPAVLKAKIPEFIEQETGRTAAIEVIKLNPFTLELTLNDFVLHERDSKDFTRFALFYININGVQSIRHLALVLDSVNLEKPYVRIARNKKGVFNFADLIKKDEAPKPEKDQEEGLFPFLIHQLKLTEGQVGWQDSFLPAPEKESISPLNLTVSELSSLTSEPAKLDLNFAVLSGGDFLWQAEVGLTPMTSAGFLKAKDLKVSRLWGLFLQNLPQVKLTEGLLGLTADYQVSLAGSQVKLDVSKTGLNIKQLNVTEYREKGFPTMTIGQLDIAAAANVSFDGKKLVAQVNQGIINLDHFTLTETGNNTELINMPLTSVQDIKADISRQEINIESFSSDNATITAWLNKDGSLNWQRVFPVSAETGKKPQTNKEKQPDWRIRLNKALLNNYAVKFTDNTQSKPVAINLSQLKLQLDPVSNEKGSKLPVKFQTTVNQSGSLSISGNIVLEPFSAQLAVAVKTIDLKPFQPYLEQAVQLEIVGGDLSTSGDISMALANPESFSLIFKGDANVSDFLTRDTIKNKDFLKWHNLKLGQISVDLLNQDYQLSRIDLDRPYIRVIIKKDGTTNINDILKAPPNTPKPTKKPASIEAKSTTTAKPKFKIGKIRLTQGMSDFADYSLILPFITQMKRLNGSLTGLSSNKNAVAKLDLKGKVYDIAGVDIKGQFNLANSDSKVDLNFKNMPLPLVTPYMAEFAGYKIEKGQMSLDLKYQIKNAKLEAQNNLYIDQFTLGEKIENPNATTLPLKLGIALLKDADGKINLDLPVTGSLDDPEFSVGYLIVKVLGNFITKIVASPFQAFGALVSSEADLSKVNFAAGKADLSDDEKTQLLELAKVLQDRPELNLEIKGAAFEAMDWPALRSDALSDKLKKLKAKELKAEGKKTRAEYITLTDEEYKRLLAQMFVDKFPLLAEYSFFGTPQLKDSEQGDFYEIAQQKLESIIMPELQRLEDLAMHRASNIAKFITEQGTIPNQRVFILATELNPEQEKPEITATLSLNAGS